jgi:hypothetical protein
MTYPITPGALKPGAGPRIESLAVARRLLVLLLGMAALFAADHEIWAAAPVKRARPPKFPKSISDVFFPDAREKLVGPRPEKRAGTAAPTDVVGNNPSAETSPEGVEGGQGWNRLITPEAIEDEIKAQQIKLSKTIQSATKFKGGEHQSARLHFSVLAMLFAIDAQYDQKMRWQREAPAMRDLMARAGFNCKVGTDASFAEAKARADELENLVRGNAVQLPEAAADPNWAKVADRQPLAMNIPTTTPIANWPRRCRRKRSRCATRLGKRTTRGRGRLPARSTRRAAVATRAFVVSAPDSFDSFTD